VTREEEVQVSGSGRRDFIRGVVLGGTGAAAAGAVPGRDEAAEDAPKQVDRRTLGRLGKEASILGVGLGSAFTLPYAGDPDAGRALVKEALKHGINYFDTARMYGPSEEIVGPVVKEFRDRIFLVSKAEWRSYEGFVEQLEMSLTALRTDKIDLYHIHNLRAAKDRDLDKLERTMVKAARDAKADGMIGGFGITGHTGSGILIEAIERWDPDAVMTTFPCTRPDQGRFEDELLPLARERKIPVIAMKTVRHARDADIKAPELIRYALSLEGVCTAVVGLDSLAHLRENVAMARGFKPMPAEERGRLHKSAVAALGNRHAPWDMPGYEDVVIV